MKFKNDAYNLDEDVGGPRLVLIILDPKPGQARAMAERKSRARPQRGARLAPCGSACPR